MGLCHCQLLKASGFAVNMKMSCRIRIDSDLALGLLLETSEGAKSGLPNFISSQVRLQVHTPKTAQGGSGKSSGRFSWSAASSLPLFRISLSGCCRLRVPWGQGCCSYSSIQSMSRTAQGPEAEGLQQQLVGWADLIELTLPSFPALTSAQSCHLFSPVLPPGGGKLQSSWAGALWGGHCLKEGKEEVRGGSDSIDETKHKGWQQWICSMHLVLQVRLEVTWPVTIPQRLPRSFVLLPSGSNQPPALFFKYVSKDSEAL